MKTFLIATAILWSGAALAQTAPADIPAKAVDFNAIVKTPMGRPFVSCEGIKDNQEARRNCDEQNTLRWIAFTALSSPADMQHPGSLQDRKNQVLGYKIGSSTAPIDLTSEERTALKQALFRAMLNQATAYAACVMVEIKADECKD
jgi:hypothetical protein